ncbi:ANTAR domain-containing response regulator [Papillibacter cinnamivorans]|uniref:Response regulator receiver and ANTAR domain protein n=1 Tax=Papillibacter cinnamivorans DSM 12816 TaxID=1122930 RepID=A0A1W2CR07_9FIRM|nr:ANTAR domain-containing protein [Papillibacter cinnamivorans]SMC87670.1 response regulator receiver and ANTAR domain protein [Papillibacter cinnamivorans DSM 12816]
MDNLLVVSSTEKGGVFIKELLTAGSFERIVTVSDGGEARRILIDSSFDIILINTPLKDEFGHELALSLTQSTSAGIILFVKSELADQVSEKVEDYGIVVVPKPVSRQLFFQSMKVISASRKRLLGLQNENARLQNKIEDMRLVDRAKCVLIQYLNLTEPQAHRYIEKHAMDMRMPKRDIAKKILMTYESR